MKLITALVATLSLVAGASLAYAGMIEITWHFDQVGPLGPAVWVTADDGESLLLVAGFRGLAPATLWGRQDDPIDHGWGVGEEGNHEIGGNDRLITRFPEETVGDIDVTLQSVDGNEAWAIHDIFGTELAHGFGGDIVNVTVPLPPWSRMLVFSVPAGFAPDDYLVSSVAYSRDVPSPDTFMLLGFGGTLLAGVVLLRRRR